jgi:hypothetical protein
MRLRTVLAWISVCSLIAGPAVFASPADAAMPTISLSPGSGPAGTTTNITLSVPCKVPNTPSNLDRGVYVRVQPANPGGPVPNQEFLEQPGQSLSHVFVSIPADAAAGHWFIYVSCFVGSVVDYVPGLFLVTGGPPLPAVTVSATSGQVGTAISVSGPCSPLPGSPFAYFAVDFFSTTTPSNGLSNETLGNGPLQHVVVKVPSTFPPGPYRIAASCFAYNNVTTFAEKAFTVVAGPPAAPAWVQARPAPTTSKGVGPIVVTYPTPLNRGAAITKYTATCASSNGGVARSGIHLGAGAAPITVANATLRRTYRCTVRAANVKGTSPAAPTSGAIIVGAPAEVGYPHLTEVQKGTLRVSFPNLSAAGANGSPLITPKYTAICKSGDGGITRAATGPGSPIVVRSLTAGKNYWCAVFAHNARGNGVPRWSSWGIYV